MLQAALQKQAWGAALARASGEKVLDDPRLLRRSMKKEAKLKSKKAAAWQERISKQKEQQQAKQEKYVGGAGAFIHTPCSMRKRGPVL